MPAFVDVKNKEALFLSRLVHPSIQSVHSCGLMIAVDFGSFEVNKKIIDALIQRGVFTDWFLFASGSLRIAPPLVISDAEIRIACGHVINVLNGN